MRKEMELRFFVDSKSYLYVVCCCSERDRTMHD